MSAANQYVWKPKFYSILLLHSVLVNINIFLNDAPEVNLKETRTKIVSSI